ncbi:MAG: hypothetical protein HXS54_01125 [Theionarchaea archaeon]|nr:hypothetical protein [Theionarchaea archaeon]
MIETLPKCLQTCWHCKDACVFEVYSVFTRKIVFCGCWILEGIEKPIKREECDKFTPSSERTRRVFWDKWGDSVYVALPEER